MCVLQEEEEGKKKTNKQQQQQQIKRNINLIVCRGNAVAAVPTYTLNKHQTICTLYAWI